MTGFPCYRHHQVEFVQVILFVTASQKWQTEQFWTKLNNIYNKGQKACNRHVQTDYLMRQTSHHYLWFSEKHVINLLNYSRGPINYEVNKQIILINVFISYNLKRE